jgi:hypothetical protein
VEDIRRKPSELKFPGGCALKVSRGPLSSGEGLVYAVRDKSEDNEDDAGVAGKRLLVVEAELGAAFRAFQRSGNNLSMILRTLFDGDTVGPLTKNSRIRATDPHVCVLGHITPQELTGQLSANDIFTGLANRFLWLLARRVKLVPNPKPMPDKEVTEVAEELARVITLAHSCANRELVMSNLAMDHWENVYPELTQDHPGCSHLARGGTCAALGVDLHAA